MVIQSGWDNFLFAPFLWIPGAYVAKGVVFQSNELVTLWNDLKEKHLLQRYWSVWFPAQMITFSVVPLHLRVPFMAAIGFLWFLLLTKLAYRKQQ